MLPDWCYLTWLSSFAALDFGVIRNTLANDDLVAGLRGRYPDVWWDVWWLVDAMGRFFYRPLGFRGVTEAIAAIASVLGCVWLYRQRRATFQRLLLPISVTLLYVALSV